MTIPYFVIDLALCTGCNACQIACRDRADLADGLDWLRIETREGGRYPHPRLEYRVVHCFHCEDAPCLRACPTKAIRRKKSGHVQIDAELCIGCDACREACPYEVIIMLPDDTASKCDGCADEVARGWDPTCVRACPMRALDYGEALPDAPRAFDDALDDSAGPRVTYLRRP